MKLQTFENGLTIRELKELVKDLPEEDDNGEPYEVWMTTRRNISNVVYRVSPLNHGDIIFDHKYSDEN